MPGRTDSGLRCARSDARPSRRKRTVTTGQPAILQSLSSSHGDQAGPARQRPAADHDRPGRRDQDVPAPGPERDRGSKGAGSRPARPQADQARVVACRLAAAGKPVSRRALRSGGVKGSNEALNALVRTINAELAGTGGG
jgi:hypothetical protein